MTIASQPTAPDLTTVKSICEYLGCWTGHRHARGSLSRFTFEHRIAWTKEQADLRNSSTPLHDFVATGFEDRARRCAKAFLDKKPNHRFFTHNSTVEACVPQLPDNHSQILEAITSLIKIQAMLAYRNEKSRNRPIDTELHDDVQRLNTVAQQRPLSNHTSGDYSAHADVYDGPDPEADASFTTPERSKRTRPEMGQRHNDSVQNQQRPSKKQKGVLTLRYGKEWSDHIQSILNGDSQHNRQEDSPTLDTPNGIFEHNGSARNPFLLSPSPDYDEQPTRSENHDHRGTVNKEPELAVIKNATVTEQGATLHQSYMQPSAASINETVAHPSLDTSRTQHDASSGIIMVDTHSNMEVLHQTASDHLSDGIGPQQTTACDNISSPATTIDLPQIPPHTPPRPLPKPSTSLQNEVDIGSPADYTRTAGICKTTQESAPTLGIKELPKQVSTRTTLEFIVDCGDGTPNEDRISIRVLMSASVTDLSHLIRARMHKAIGYDKLNGLVFMLDTKSHKDEEHNSVIYEESYEEEDRNIVRYELARGASAQDWENIKQQIWHRYSFYKGHLSVNDKPGRSLEWWIMLKF